MTAAHELTTTAHPLRLSVPTPEVVTLPFNAVRRSPLNPRKKFDLPPLVRLAVSIYQRTVFDDAGQVLRTGIEQHLLGRPAEGDTAEIAAGERRHRAVKLLIDGLHTEIQEGEDANGRPVMREVFYQVGPDYPMPFKIQPLTDAELIELATLENSQRQDMTPMEEADAFLALIGAGRTPEYVASKYGLHPNTVKSRIQLAGGLGREGRKLLDEGRITLEHAKIISTTSGALKKALTEQAQHGASVAILKRMIHAGAFLVENALFDAEKSGLRIEEGLLGDFPAKFSDHRAALTAQLEALERLSAEEAATTTPDGQPRWAAVEIVTIEGEYADLDPREWAMRFQLPEGMKGSLILTYSTQTGKHQRIEGVARRRDVWVFEEEARQAREAERAEDAGNGSAPQEAPLSPPPPSTAPAIREAAHEIGHQTRCQALNGYLASHPQMCLALACQSLIQAERHMSHRSLMGLKVSGRREVPMTPEGRALGQTVAERFPLLFVLKDNQLSHRDAFKFDVLEELTHPDVTAADLLAVFAYFTHRQTGAWEEARSKPSSAVAAFAEQIKADADLIQRFTLSADFLNAYTAEGLHALMATMPEAARPAGTFKASKKELVALIVEKAAALKQAGWLPGLITFK
ncbi:ParB/RepB/Spo0J family partition protein [Deinococcus sp.]|uniref:ParB/RepB/Spo0J family partition protein n=1 Tax=Deinococcus sp. TaxID=47478 RepID=UPI003B5971A6